MRLSLSDRVAAWIYTLLCAPLVFVLGLVVLIALTADHGTRPGLVPVNLSHGLVGLFGFTALLMMHAATPTLVLGVPAAAVLERLRVVSRLVYAATGFVAGFIGGLPMLVLYEVPPAWELASVLGAYGAIAAAVFRTFTRRMERAARRA